MNGWCGLQPAEVDLRLARTENTHTQNKKTKTVNTHSCTLLLLPLPRWFYQLKCAWNLKIVGITL